MTGAVLIQAVLCKEGLDLEDLLDTVFERTKGSTVSGAVMWIAQDKYIKEPKTVPTTQQGLDKSYFLLPFKLKEIERGN